MWKRLSSTVDLYTYDSWHSASAIWICCDAAKEVQKLLWLVLRVNKLNLVRYALLLQHNLAPLSERAAASTGMQSSALPSATCS